MKYRFAIVLSSVLIMSTMTYCADTGGAQYRGFPTQQEAAEAFLQSMAAGDFTGALSVFDCGLEASAYTFPNKAARLNAINMFTIPTEYAGFVELNHISLRNRAADQLLSFVYNLLLEGKYAPFPNEGMIFRKGKSAAEWRQAVEEFSRSVDPARLAGIKFLHLDTAISFLQKDDDESFVEKYSTHQQRRIDAEGIEDLMDCVMYFSWNGGVYVCGVVFTQYADGWHIDALISYFIDGLGSAGAVKKLNATPDEFERAMEADLIHLLLK